MYNHLDSIPACDRQTDGQTDILSRHSPRYAYTSRGKNPVVFGCLTNVALLFRSFILSVVIFLYFDFVV